MGKNEQMSNRKKRRINLWALFYSIALTGYTIFTLLYTFVIPRDVVSMSGAWNSVNQEKEVNHGDENQQIAGEKSGIEEGRQQEDTMMPVITDNSYESSTISIKIDTIREYDTDIYVADIRLKSAQSLLSGLAKNSFGRNVTEKTSEIAKDNDAIFAVNGDFYGFRDEGYVMRNGYLYRSTKRSGNNSEDLVIYEDGSFEIINESEVTAGELEEKGAVQIFSFGPGLIQDGEIIVGEKDEVDQSMTSNPRTAIGMIEPLHYIIVVSDGRTSESEGLTLYQLAGLMKEYGCTQAYNLDGGGSSTMWFNGEIVNQPTSHGKIKERSVSDIVFIR